MTHFFLGNRGGAAEDQVEGERQRKQDGGSKRSEGPKGPAVSSSVVFAYYLRSSRAGLELRPSSGSQPTCQPTVVRMGGLYVGGYFLLLGRDLQKSHLPHSAPQARSDAVTDLELSFIWLLWGWQAKDCTFHEVHYSSTEYLWRASCECDAHHIPRGLDTWI